jgi:hypothetical protein
LDFKFCWQWRSHSVTWYWIITSVFSFIPNKVFVSEDCTWSTLWLMLLKKRETNYVFINLYWQHRYSSDHKIFLSHFLLRIFLSNLVPSEKLFIMAYPVFWRLISPMGRSNRIRKKYNKFKIEIIKWKNFLYYHLLARLLVFHWIFKIGNILELI